MALGVHWDRWFPPMAIPIQAVLRNGKYPFIANHTGPRNFICPQFFLILAFGVGKIQYFVYTVNRRYCIQWGTVVIIKSFLAFTQFHRRGQHPQGPGWMRSIHISALRWWRWSFKISSFDQVRDFCGQCRAWFECLSAGIPNVSVRLIIFKRWSKCLHLVGCPRVNFVQAFNIQVLPVTVNL